jgi:hydrogenase nickel incorporation protein HypA/HybF
MHELSVCQSIIQQAIEIAQKNHAFAINKIDLAIGPLAGIDAQLLAHAFPIASAGTLAETAELNTTLLPIKIKCQTCSLESDAQANRLICAHCGDWHTTLISGDEMLITSIELETTENTTPQEAHYV